VVGLAGPARSPEAPSFLLSSPRSDPAARPDPASSSGLFPSPPVCSPSPASPLAPCSPNPGLVQNF